MRSSKEDRQIFYDPKRRRWNYVGRPFLLLVAFLGLTFGITLASFFSHPTLPGSQLLASVSFSNREDNNYQPDSGFPHLASIVGLIGRETALKYENKINLLSRQNDLPTEKELPKTVAFFVNWDEESSRSLENNLNNIDILMPEWIHLADQDGNLEYNDLEKQKKTLDFIKEKQSEMLVMPLINNFSKKNKTWDKEVVTKMLKTPKARSATIENLRKFVVDNEMDGINIDFEGVPAEDQANLIKFMQELNERFSFWNLRVSQSIPFIDPVYDVKELSKHNNFLVLMAYDQNVPGTTLAGPIAGQKWFRDGLQKRFSQIDPSKVVVALGNYAYDWNENSTTGKPLTFREAMVLARKMGKKTVFDQKEMNPYFKYDDEGGGKHDVWLLNAVTAYNEVAYADDFNPYGYALWRLGSEDSSIWKVFEKRAVPSDFGVGYEVEHEGEGDILKITSLSGAGERLLDFESEDKYISDEYILEYPSPYVVTHYGKRSEGKKRLVLTFDDGPDKKYTPAVLDILKKNDIKATFFIIGANAVKHPEIIQRIAADGHEIGNHTFTHPYMSHISESQVEVELSSVQRLIESVTASNTALFRPPYGEGLAFESYEQIKPLVLASQYGYYTAGMEIDPKDYIVGKDAKTIAVDTVKIAEKEEGNIVLLHDGGGDRSEVIKALPMVISELKRKGYQFVTMSEILDAPSKEITPQASVASLATLRANVTSLWITDLVATLLLFLFVLGIAVGFLRAILIMILAIIHKKVTVKKRNKTLENSYQPLVSVLIPAFNEEKVIVKTIKAILESDYFNFELIVIDDGSTDQTAEKAREIFSGDHRGTVYSIDNGGKYRALNFGIEKSKGKIVITLDGDTIFKEDTLGKLVRNFKDEKVGAVAGNIKVGNRINFLTKNQALEYIINQNLDKRAFDVINCIPVVPGSIGAWRRTALVSAGGFSGQTFAEDADLTFSVIIGGHRVIYDEEAVAFTEAPDTVEGLLKQRFRWMFGTLQAAWKYRRAYFNRKYGSLGMVAIPNILIYQFIFSLLLPVMDIILVFSVFWIVWQGLQHPIGYPMMQNIQHLMFFYLIYLALDLAISIVAYSLEKGENKKLLIWVVLQRFYYRQLMYIVSIRTLHKAFRGSLDKWNKVERKDTVKAVGLDYETNRIK